MLNSLSKALHNFAYPSQTVESAQNTQPSEQTVPQQISRLSEIMAKTGNHVFAKNMGSEADLEKAKEFEARIESIKDLNLKSPEFQHDFVNAMGREIDKINDKAELEEWPPTRKAKAMRVLINKYISTKISKLLAQVYE